MRFACDNHFTPHSSRGMTNFSPDDDSDLRLSRASSQTVSPLVLVVEDHEDTRFLLRTLLEMRGIRVAEAEDGEAGASAAEELHPDLILMDWSLPRMDGLATTRLIRERDPSSHAPIVFLSGNASHASRADAHAAGCCAYLMKPLDLDELERVLREHLLSSLMSEPPPARRRAAS